MGDPIGITGKAPWLEKGKRRLERSPNVDQGTAPLDDEVERRRSAPLPGPGYVPPLGRPQPRPVEWPSIETANGDAGSDDRSSHEAETVVVVPAPAPKPAPRRTRRQVPHGAASDKTITVRCDLGFYEIVREMSATSNVSMNGLIQRCVVAQYKHENRPALVPVVQAPPPVMPPPPAPPKADIDIAAVVGAAVEGALRALPQRQ